MKIALVGGIYGKDAQYRAAARMTPETTLERGLKARGCRVDTFSHYSRLDGRLFDLIHVHHLSYGAVRAATDRSDAPFVYTSHDGLAMVGLAQTSLKRIAAHFVMSRADAVVALSKKEADFQQRTYSLSGAAHSIIPNGVDFTNYSYARRNPRRRGQPWRLLFVGQLIEEKRVDVLLRALATLDQPAELSLAYHNSAMELCLKKLASGLGDSVCFLGPKTPAELAVLYQRADLFVLPSGGEALPSVITEAMACGTPIVATDVGGVREQLGGYGLIVRPGQVEELAAAISQVLDNYQRFADQGWEMSQHARREFSIDTMVDRHLELYSQLVEQQGPPRRHSLLWKPLSTGLRMGVNLLCATK